MPDFGQHRVVAEVETHHRAGVVKRQGFPQFVQTFQRVGNGFFDQQVGAGARSRQGCAQVCGGRVGNNNALRFFGQRLCQIREYRQPFQVFVRQRGAVRAVKQDILLPERAQVAQVPPADRT